MSNVKVIDQGQMTNSVRTQMTDKMFKIYDTDVIF